MRIYSDNLIYHILFLCSHTDNALSSPSLSGIDVGRQTLDIPVFCKSNHTSMTLNQVLINNFIGWGDNFGSSFIGIFTLDFKKIILNDLFDSPFVSKNILKILNQSHKLFQLVLNLLSFKSGKLSERHLNDSLRLFVGKTEPFAKRLLCAGNRGGCFHYLHNFIDIVKSDFISFENMSSCFSLCKLENRTVFDNTFLMRNIVIKHLRKRKHLRFAVYNGKHIDGTGILKLRILIELI